jgi:hypothetical protein
LNGLERNREWFCLRVAANQITWKPKEVVRLIARQKQKQTFWRQKMKTKHKKSQTIIHFEHELME